jgi:hypothetical protein
MRARLVVAGGPTRERVSSVAEIVEDRLIEQFVAHSAVERLTDPICIGAMKCQAIRCSCAHASITFEVNSVPWSETIRPGLPRQAMSASSSRGTRRPEIGLEAYGSAHYWARELVKLGHDARLMAPAYVKAYVRRQKNDAADAAAIYEAVTRPSMRFVPLRSLENQAALMHHGVREMLVAQRTQGWCQSKFSAILGRVSLGA